MFQRLWYDFPGDVGCFVIYFLNLIQLKPGEAMFLGPNLPHAYLSGIYRNDSMFFSNKLRLVFLSGDCIECMACSDNVVRAGLTPKLIDVPTLCDMLIYECPEDGKVDETFKFKPIKESDHSLVFNAPVPDFSVAQFVAKNPEKIKFPARNSASIVIIVDCNDGKYSVIHAGEQVGKIDFMPFVVKFHLLKNSID